MHTVMAAERMASSAYRLIPYKPNFQAVGVKLLTATKTGKDVVFPGRCHQSKVEQLE